MIWMNLGCRAEIMLESGYWDSEDLVSLRAILMLLSLDSWPRCFWVRRLVATSQEILGRYLASRPSI